MDSLKESAEYSAAGSMGAHLDALFEGESFAELRDTGAYDLGQDLDTETALAFAAMLVITYDQKPGQSWRYDAICYGSRQLFQPDPKKKESMDNPETARRAREICAGCPVIKECLEFGVNDRDPENYIGGASPDQRDEIRRLLRGTKPAYDNSASTSVIWHAAQQVEGTVAHELRPKTRT